MSAELFGDYEKLLRVQVMGQEMQMPEHNSLLRGLQFAVPRTISYGRFCWNGDCNNCAVTVLHCGSVSNELACRMDASEGMQITAVSWEIKRLL